ncbi:fas-binding factor 1 isoform X3 [Oncorhynchus tshawytscha]|uniref:fas-binding factor 1 isoform X3 n=1 Tax=Oncorhynchus tshawytscha TaxID=74940 RepID=UPI000D099D22|nr:fas-binding factor 1 isoform X3 [Oncorhynchus tshawytscha]
MSILTLVAHGQTLRISFVAKQKKGQKSSIDDMLGDLLGDDDFPVKAKALAREAGRLGPPLPSHSGKRSLLGDDDFFSKLAEEAENDEGSDVSEADPTALLESMKDIDDMDADLFGSKKKPSSAPAQSKGSGIGGPTKNPPKSGNKLKGGISDEPDIEEKKPSSAPASTARGYKRFSFTNDDDDVLAPTTDTKDFDDPLADLLDDLPIEDKNEPKITKKAPPEKSVLPPDSPIIKKKETASPTPVPKKRDELTFDDDEDDLMDALGFGESPKESPKKKETVLIPKNESSSELPQRARTRLDEILGRGTSPRLLERPPTGERKDPPQQQEKQKHHQETPTTKDPFLEEDLTFGSYQPTLVTTPEGRHSRRQSVRFSTEDNSASSPEKKPKPITPTTLTPTFSRPAADWLGLSQDDEEEPPPVPEPLKTPSSSSVGSKPSSSGNHIPQPSTETPNTSFKYSKPVGPSVEVSASQKHEDDWLSGALSRKKTQSSTQSEEKRTTQEDFLGFGDEVDLESFLSKRGSSPASRRKEASTPNKEPGDSPLPREPSHRQPSPTAHSTPVREDQFRPAVSARVGFYPDQTPDPSPLPTSATISFPLPQQYHPPALQDQREPGWPSQAELPPNYPAQPWQSMSGPMPHAMMPGSMRLPQQSQMQNTAPVVQPQVSLSANSLQKLLLQQQLESQLLGLGGAVDVAGLQRQKRDTEKQNGDLALQARIIKLEGQVRSLQQELDQNQILLESVQQRHKQDTELMENTHRARVKLLDDSAAQREARARQECEDLAERLATVTRIAEQERMELQAKHQRRLAQTQQDRDREVERLRDLQRKSILEMKKDHEDQVQRLKRLKDEEIDAVTSATSQTRSLTVVIEQMEHFSHRLGDLSSRVESTHENTAQGLEQGARQRDEQLRVMQDRLGQQQRAMAEERTRLKEVIAKMDTQLAEQQRQLEKERWRVNAEQAKADSSQRGLDEERRSLTQHISMEREELERAKSALLEEQQQVMQRCAEERRKLAAEWTQFHTQEKQRQDRAEREASRALERDAHREGSIISMAQEQVDLKLRAGELKQHEAAVAREREALERQREELDREKERLSGTGLQLKTRAQEVEAFSKLASEKYNEGEKALQESRQVETEHQTRLRSIHSQMERLRQQEQHLHQERMKMTEQRREMEALKHSLPITPFPQSMAPIFTDFRPVLAVPQMASTKAVRQPPPLVSSPDSTELQARLALLRHTAEKDRDFLQDEQFFLDTLKKAPYNSAFHTD